VLIALPSGGYAQSAIKEEAVRRNDALVREGFNTTRTFEVRGADLSLRTELIVPPHGGEE